MPPETVSRHTPSGFQHCLELQLQPTLAERHADALSALSDLQNGLQLPLVEVVQVCPGGTVVVQLSLFSADSAPSARERAALEGYAAELMFADATARTS